MRTMVTQGFPGGDSGKEATCQQRRSKRLGFDPWVGKIPWRRKWQPTPIFLPGESHGQRSLAGYSPSVQFSSAAQLCLTLCNRMDCSPPLSMGFSRPENWSGLPFPPPGDLPNPRIEPKPPAFLGGFFTTEPPGKHLLLFM